MVDTATKALFLKDIETCITLLPIVTCLAMGISKHFSKCRTKAITNLWVIPATNGLLLDTLFVFDWVALDTGIGELLL